MSLTTKFQGWLGNWAAKTIQREHPTVISVSGTVGKTTTRQAIAAVLGAHNPKNAVRAPIKNYNNELGVPLTIFGLKAPGRSIPNWLSILWQAWLTSMGVLKTNIQTFVLEMGVDKPGDFAYLLKIAKPTIAVITAITPDDPTHVPSHTANFPSLDALAEEESAPAHVLTEKDTLILNADDARLFRLRQQTKADVVLYGEMDQAEVRLVRTQVNLEEGEYGCVPTGISIELESFNRPLTISIPGLFGRSVGYAIAGAMAVAETLDVDYTLAKERLEEELKPMPGRTRIIPGIKHTTLFDDSYNASPVAVLSALRDLAGLNLHPAQRRAACLGEMRELGERAEEMHRLIGREAANLKIDLLVACGTLARAIEAGALAAGMNPEQIQVFEDTPEAGLFLQEWIKPGDIVLAKASEGARDSKGVRMERVIKELMAEPLRAEELLCRQGPEWQMG